MPGKGLPSSTPPVEWFDEGAADGFDIMPPELPGGLTAFVDHVVPLLQRRGVFRREYEGRTLRDHFGLSRPTNGDTVDRRVVAARTEG